jgi:anti-sigma B factor antagonist
MQGVIAVMESFSIREAPEALVVLVEDAAALNDFRSNSFRDALYEAVEGREGGRFALDLGTVDFLSSSGVAILVGLKRRVDGLHGKLVIFGVQPVVQDLLRITRLMQYFTFADDEKAALALLRPLPTA